MDSKNLVAELVAIVGREDALSGKRDLLVYEYDGTPDLRMPDVVVFPTSAQEVSAIMKLAQREKVAVTPRGAGTNLSGGSLAEKGGIVLSFTRMNRILEINTADRYCIVEPGVVNLDLQNTLAPLGFIYAPDPSSQKSSTLGGNIGEDAGGPHCFKYGVTSNHVIGMEVVLPDGSIVNFGGVTADTPGYDLTGLICGSEGTIGVVTSTTLRIIPLPETIKTLLAIYESNEDAGQTVSDIVAAGMVPATLEIMDNKVINAVEASAFRCGLPTDAAAVLLVELDGVGDGMERQAEQIVEFCKKNKAREVRVARTAAERDALWAGRKGAFGAIARLATTYAVQDGTVPRSHLAEMLHAVYAIADKHGVMVANVAHAGDGNLHPLFPFDPNEPGRRDKVNAACRDILATCVSFGGTISGEHGVGIEKKAMMPFLFSPVDLRAMSALKLAFDPNNLLNPDKIIPEEFTANHVEEVAAA